MKIQMLKFLFLGSVISLTMMSCSHGAHASSPTTRDTMQPIKHDTMGTATRSSATSVRHDTIITSRDSMHSARMDTTGSRR